MFNSWKEWTCVFFCGELRVLPLESPLFCGTPPGHHSRSSMAMFRGPLGGSPKLSMAGDPFALEGRLWTCSPWIIVMVYSNRVIMVIGLTLDAVGFCCIGDNIIVRLDHFISSGSSQVDPFIFFSRGWYSTGYAMMCMFDRKETDLWGMTVHKSHGLHITGMTGAGTSVKVAVACGLW